MMADEIIGAAALELGDTEGVRWNAAKLVVHLNAALDELLLIRPDALSELRTVALVAGAQQEVPEDAARFIGAVRNMGAHGATPGRTISNSDMDVLSAFSPDWMASPSAPVIVDVFFDESAPRYFFCYPPAEQDTHIQVRIAKEHARITSAEDAVNVSGRFRAPLIYLVLAFAYHENTDVGSKQLAWEYEKQANRLLGVSIKVDSKQPPANKRNTG